MGCAFRRKHVQVQRSPCGTSSSTVQVLPLSVLRWKRYSPDPSPTAAYTRLALAGLTATPITRDPGVGSTSDQLAPAVVLFSSPALVAAYSTWPPAVGSTSTTPHPAGSGSWVQLAPLSLLRNSPVSVSASTASLVVVYRRCAGPARLSCCQPCGVLLQAPP